MKVAIIGAGNVGKALGTSITRAGHEVTITARHPENAVSAAREIGATPAPSNSDAVRDADVVILAVPFVGAAEAVATEISDAVAGKAVIDVTNPLKPDYSGPAVADGSAAEEQKAKRTVISLVESIGFTALDVGPLSSARFLEGMAFINIGVNAANGWGWTSAWKLER